uniref:NADPH-dependent glutamate synthase beta chain n=1 Tax=Candidatus Kentrum sp. SD TaxID=2126332 RepID=A0A450YXP6_9GAMM|nr:MAG: NADPH-dependent glutamate synthase beta chain [Candidatus Kentron sp. SD]VFK46293.1 MAG: NADPH-dependent glutamate synthase beta chain [Candidatus Kentron sp. SD]VFK79981.1 MAG: NADPH-dependent glutamate synthase beta chain [Candidatus Kentron sp. SD]
MATPWSKTYRAENHTFRKFKDGDSEWSDWEANIFAADGSHKCPTYVHRTPPCQGSCPAGEDIRGWLQIVRGIEKPPEGMTWQEYAFRRSTDANPFPSQMGRVCPAPCQDGCNRNEVEDFVHINAIEQYIGDYASEHGFRFECSAEVSSKKVAIIGGGPAGMTAAYQLRRKGHGSVIFDDHQELGGMMRYGIPGYRVPRGNLDKEINRILDMGSIEVRTGIKVGKDISIEELERDFDAILWTIGCQAGRALPVPKSDVPNCITGVQFLDAFNSGRMQVSAQRIVCVGGGDTSIDVVSVARRLGHIQTFHPNERAEDFVHGFVALDTATVAKAEGANVTLTSLFKKEEMTAAEHEVQDALTEGVTVLDGVMPVEILLNDHGRAKALKMAECAVDGKGIPTPVEGTEFEIECDLVVSAIGQSGNLAGLEVLDNGRGLIDADGHYRVPKRSGHFVAGDIVRPHLLTTAVGQASIAAESIDNYLAGKELDRHRRSKVDVHHFNLLNKLQESGMKLEEYKSTQDWGTDESAWAIHNFEDRSTHEIVHAEDLFLAHFGQVARHVRKEQVPAADEVLGHFEERIIALSEEETVAEAKRCMSCGMCFECDNCVIFCPQDAVFRVKKGKSTTGRYVDTDYARCIGCHICADVCPTGYIDMGLGE